MIIVMETDASPDQIEAVEKKIRDLGYKVHEIVGVERKVIGAVGDGRGKEQLQAISSMAGVENAIELTGPAGLVSVHHGCTIHGSSRNDSISGRPASRIFLIMLFQ